MIGSRQNRATPARRTVPRGLRVVFSLFLLLAVLGVLAVAGSWAWLHHAMRAGLPQLDGTLHVSGLTAPVTVRRDAHGVPHIEAESVDDMLEAQGYVTAQDRLWQMDMARRMAAGEGAEVIGAKLIPHDRLQRVIAFRATAERMIATMPASQLEQLNAYARGVNRYIADCLAGNGTQLPAEFRLLMYKPKAWRPVDSMLVALTMAQMLDESWQDKLAREQVMARLNAAGQGALAADLYPVGSWRDHPPVSDQPDISAPQPAVPPAPLDSSQSSLQNPKLPAELPALDLQMLRALVADGRHACQGCTPGSNEWAVSGAHTASGKPMLSNDMHLGHAIPDLWYEVDLHGGSFHAAGVTVPGLPFVAVGHNDHIAWGFTALGGDTQDLYIEKTRGDIDGGQAEYRSGPTGVQASQQQQQQDFAQAVQPGHALQEAQPETWQPIEREQERIHVRGAADVVLTLERTAHGPVVTSIIPGEKRVVTLKWALYDPKAAGLPLYALNTANDWQSFRAALASWWAPTLNAVYADDQGHIGYQAIGLIPTREGGLQGLPVASLDHEWTGTLPFEQLPSAYDPANGILATANARITPDGAPYQVTLEWANPYRNERIWKQLTGKRGLTQADMIALQTDTFSEIDQQLGQRLAYAIDRASHADARLRTAADILRTWDGVVSVDSPAAAIVNAAKGAFWPAVLTPRLGPGAEDLYAWKESDYAREQMITHAPAAWLPPGFANWDDFLADVVQTGLKQANAPAKLRDWKYGTAHTIEIDHPLYSLLPTFKRWTGIGPLPQSGDQTTVKQVKGSLGPSQRFTIDWSDVDKATENIVMGESEDPVSPFYRDQWKYWYGGSTFALPFTPGAVAASAAHTLRLLP